MMDDDSNGISVESGQSIHIENMTNSTLIGRDHVGDLFINPGINGKPVDMAQLALDLQELRLYLRQQSPSIEYDIAIAAVAKAERSAIENNYATVLKHLKTAGSWVLDTATEIGVSVAAQALKQALGL